MEPAAKPLSVTHKTIYRQSLRHMPSPTNFQRMKGLGIPDPIPIDFSFSRKPGMKVRGNPPATNNPDTGWKIGVERHSPSQPGQPIRGNINMSGLSKSMNSRVSSTSAMQSDLLIQVLLPRRFHI